MTHRPEEQMNLILEWRMRVQNYIIAKQLGMIITPLKRYDVVTMEAEDRQTIARIDSEFKNKRQWQDQ